MALEALAVGLALGHALAHPKRDRVAIDRDRVRVELSHELAPGDEARKLRALFDRDRSGVLDEGEARAAAIYLARTAALFLEVHVDGLPVQLAPGEPVGRGLAGPAGDDSGISVRLSLEVRLPPLASSPRVVRIADRDREPGVEVPCRVEAGPGLLIAASTAQGGAAFVDGLLTAGQAIEVAVVLAD